MPVGVADERDGGGVEALVVGFEATAEDGLDAHDIEEILRDGGGLRTRRFALAADGADVAFVFGCAG